MRVDLRRARFDGGDAIAVGAAVLVVGGLLGYGALTHAPQAKVASVVAPIAAATTPTPTPTATTRRVAVIASGDQQASAFSAGIADAVDAPVQRIAGAGYAANTDGYATAAAKVAKATTLVVIVPSYADAQLSTLGWQGPLARTATAVKKAAPQAQVLLVGPIGADSQAGQLASARSAIRSFAVTAKLHFIDGVAHHWVGAQVDAINALPTSDALKDVGAGIGAEAKRLLAG